MVTYLFGPGRHEEHRDQRVVACSDPTWVGTLRPDRATLAQLVAELDDPMVRFGDRTKDGYVYHVVVSIPAEDGQLTDTQWQDAAHTFADRIGLDAGVQWVAVHHGLSANGNDHIHLVVDLVRDDGQMVNLWQDGLKRRGACLELEEKYGLTGTARAGLGQGSLSRREVEQVRGGQVASVTDLTRHRVASLVRGVAAGARSEPEFVERLRGEGLIVRARLDKTRAGQVVGYSIAARGGDVDGRLIWYGGGTLGKDLRLPALRTKWQQTAQQQAAAASAWASESQRSRKAEPRNLAGAATALRTASSLLERVPAADQFAWYQAATDSAGVLAAAAATTSDERIRRQLISAWKSIHQAVPLHGIDVEPAAAAEALASEARVDGRPIGALGRQDVVAWPHTSAVPSSSGAARESSVLLAGAARVLMAARLADASHAAQVQALLVQAAELAAQITRTLAARRDATDAERRAAAAAQRAAAAVTAAGAPTGWQFDKAGTRVLGEARAARAGAEDHAVPNDGSRAVGPDPESELGHGH